MPGARSPTVAATDGSCVGPPDRRTGLRAGGWAAVMVHGVPDGGDAGTALRTVLAGGMPDTTSNRMELTAAIEALRAAPVGPLTVVSDSRYLVDGMTQRLAPLKARGFKTPAGRRVPNRDLWKALDALCAGRTIEWRWAKGHAGVPDSDLADQLARTAAERQRLELRGRDD